MAKVLGKAGRYLSEQALKKFQKIILILYVFGCGVGFIGGYSISAKHGIYISLATILLFIIAFIYVRKNIVVFESERLKFRKGAVGEAAIGYILENFPDEYYVVHDIATPSGNIDHVVVGPSGVYVIDTKNWKGVVSADGNGELLLNGKPTGKPEVKNLTRNIMNMREKVKTLCSLEPYMQGILAFPSAYVDAKWGATGHANCVADEKLYDYIVENNRGIKLDKQQIEVISGAFKALAEMDKGFGE